MESVLCFGKDINVKIKMEIEGEIKNVLLLFC